MELQAEKKEEIWQAARCGDVDAVRQTLGNVNTALAVRPAQEGEQVPLRVLLCSEPASPPVCTPFYFSSSHRGVSSRMPPMSSSLAGVLYGLHATMPVVQMAPRCCAAVPSNRQWAPC